MGSYAQMLKTYESQENENHLSVMKFLYLSMCNYQMKFWPFLIYSLSFILYVAITCGLMDGIGNEYHFNVQFNKLFWTLYEENDWASKW